MASSSTPWEKQSQLGNAFEELAPHSASASIEPWDIYINHCGADARQTLATLIYDKLNSTGFRVFLDVEAIVLGDSLPSQIQDAIASAKLHIAIFTPSYAQSPSLLAELSFMLKTGGRIIPIFYRVYRSDLRRIKHGEGMYAAAFSDHEKGGRYTSEKLYEWKSALQHCSFLAGYMVYNSTDEVTVLKDIVNCAFRNMGNPLLAATHPVGLHELVEGFESVAREEKIKITGIVGMGGSGKTTLAKELFNINFSPFERRSFVFDVRYAASRGALLHKQKKLLKDLGVESLTFDTVEEGKAILANHLSSLRVLLVLDDVDHIDQLYALLPNRETLDSQSLVIITTQDLGVLNSWGISSIYKMPALKRLHAEQLFCWNAFLQPFPPLEFETMVQEFVSVCCGLPLSLKVLGAQLYGRKSIDYWKSLLDKVLKIFPGDIRGRLQLSYDALDEEIKGMFLDTACFLTGERIGTAIAVLDASRWSDLQSGLHGLETLVNQCLVELVDDPDSDGESIIWIHNQLTDMGREIASKQSTYRIWSSEQIPRWREHSSLNQGRQNARAFVAFKEYMESMSIPSKHFTRLKFSNELEILSVEGNELTEKFATLSENLVWLRWESFPLRCLPAWLILRNLRVIELHGADELEALWEDNAKLPLELRQLIILDTKKLQRLPSSIGRLQHLKTLEFSFHGTTFPKELCGVQSLERLALSCRVLSLLPDDFGNLISLRSLSLVYCTQLMMLPDSFRQLVHLEDLNLSGCERLSSLPDSFGNLKSLRNLNLAFCRHLRMLPDSFCQLIHLEKLDLSCCETLSSLPAGFGNLISLRYLTLKYCNQLRVLPESLPKLIQSLRPAGFDDLSSRKSTSLELSRLPAESKQRLQASFDIELDQEQREMFLDVACFLNGERKSRVIAVWDGSGWSGLRGLETLVNKCLVELVDDPDSDGEKIIRMHDSVRDMGREIAGAHSPYRIWFSGQIIESSKLSRGRKLIRSILPADAFEAFKQNMHQSMGGSHTLSLYLAFLSGPQILFVGGNDFTDKLASLSKDLVWLRWEGFPGRHLPSWLQLRNLSVLELHGANEMEELWKDRENAPLRLRELIITGTWSASFERFPSSISNLKILKKIALLGEVGKEFGIKELPEEFCDLWSLEHLELRHCILLSSLPARFGDLRNLRHVDLCFCKALRRFPASFQHLIFLSYLDLSGCKRLLLQTDILGNITKLKKLYLSGCLALQKMPHQITDQAYLRELRLQHTHLKDLPSNIGQLSDLEVLAIGSPLLKSLPDSLGNLSRLKSLSITDCFALEYLPKTLGNLALLEHLCIEATAVRSLPEGFMQLANLRTLKISDCPLSELDFGSTSSFSLEKLTEINLSETLVTRISFPEHCCPRLETLQLSKNDKLEVVENLPATAKIVRK